MNENCFIYFPELFWGINETTYVKSATQCVVQRRPCILMSIQILYPLEIFLRKSQLPQEVSLTTWFFHFFPVFPLPLKYVLLQSYKEFLLSYVHFLKWTKLSCLGKHNTNTSWTVVEDWSILLYTNLCLNLFPEKMYITVSGGIVQVSWATTRACHVITCNIMVTIWVICYSLLHSLSPHNSPLRCSYYCPHSPDKQNRCSYIK